MAFEPQNIRALVAEIASPTARERELAAEKAAGWVSETLDPTFAAALSQALDLMVSLEDSNTALEAQLNAVAEISARGLAPADSIARVISARSWDQPWAAEYIEGLQDDLPIAPQ
jgi:uncharacterized protein YdbL (DUF1318 family)